MDLECQECGKSIDPIEIDGESYPRLTCDECEVPDVDHSTEQTRESRRRALEAAGVPRRQRMIGDVDLLPPISKWLDREYPQPDNGMLLYGPTGSGKSVQSGQAIRRWLSEYPRSSALYVKTMPTIRSWQPGRDAVHSFRAIRGAGLVVLDDIAKASASEWVAERLYEIIDARADRCQPTILTTNATYEQLQQLDSIDAETWRRIEQMCPSDNVLRLPKEWWE